MTDMISNPPHYQDASGIECKYVTKVLMGWPSNVFKYAYRAGQKDKYSKDISKARQYAIWCKEHDEKVSQEAYELIIKVSDYRPVNIRLIMRAIAISDWDSVIKLLSAELERGEND